MKTRSVQELLEQVTELQRQHAQGEDVGAELAGIRTQLERAKSQRGGSRFAGPGASLDVVQVLAKGGHVAANGDLIDAEGKKVGTAHAPSNNIGTALAEPMRPGQGNELLRMVWAARKGDPVANARLNADQKGWLEGTGSAGGFLVDPEILPGYVEVRRAGSPLRERCRNFVVASDEVWIVTEGNAVTVAHTAEAATLPESTGTVGQKVATTFKLAGTSKVTRELLLDSNGEAGQLVGRQFGQQIGIEVDKAIISGTGTGQPTGIRGTAGVNAQAVDGQTGRELVNSVIKAIGRLRERFHATDTIAIHPRDLTKVETALTTTNEYLFPGGLDSVFPGKVVVDPNLPTNLGAGTNESVILVGEFNAGAYYWQREALRIDASEDAAWNTDEVSFKGTERYGFAVVLPGAFEVLTGITP